MKTATITFVILVTVALPATAAPLFSDNFNSVGQAFSWNGSPNWTVANAPGGSVDLIGDGGLGIELLPPGNGNYVDLDGSSGVNGADGTPGLLRTTQSFAAGTYVLQFDLAGNQRNADTDLVTVTLGNWTEQFLLGRTDPLTPYTRLITTTGGFLQFQNSAPNSGFPTNEGALLDNVSVSVPAVTSTPEPATLAVFGGLILAGAFGHRRPKGSA